MPLGSLPKIPVQNPFPGFSTFKLLECLPRIKDSGKWHEAVLKILPAQDIGTSKRLAAFLAQCGHESMDFTAVSENLNYSAKALQSVFKKYFPDEATAKAYERQPERIANRVYANRMGNGDEKSGDGWKFRGRGLIQLTGKNNYKECSVSIFTDERLLTDPGYLVTTDGALLSACWFWRKNSLNAFADIGDMLTLTKRINGGTHGLEDRMSRYARACAALGIPLPATKPTA